MTRLIGRLQALRGQPMWAREQPTLQQPWVGSAADVAAFVQTGGWVVGVGGGRVGLAKGFASDVTGF